MGVSKNRGTPPKSSILIGFSLINHPFWGTPIFGNTHILKTMEGWRKKIYLEDLAPTDLDHVFFVLIPVVVLGDYVIWSHNHIGVVVVSQWGTSLFFGQ